MERMVRGLHYIRRSSQTIYDTHEDPGLVDCTLTAAGPAAAERTLEVAQFAVKQAQFLQPDHVSHARPAPCQNVHVHKTPARELDRELAATHHSDGHPAA